MLRNREICIYSAIAILLSIVAALICFSFHPAAGIACLLGCLCVLALCLVFTIRRYKQMAGLAEYLKRLTAGNTPLDIRENTEGELSILKNEIYKVTVALREQAGQLQKDKQQLATALSDISHQLKTPLTSLMIMIDLLENPALPPEKQQEFVTAMGERLLKMEWLVLSLLKMARLDADAVVWKRVSVPLSAIAEKALAPMLVPMEIKNQHYTLTGEDATVLCDLEWTAEAVGNIVKNAVENTPQNGTLSLTYGTNPLYAYITVHDGGPGIAQADLPYLFRRFYRGKSAGADSVGIGLAMSQAIFRRQDGDITAENDNGGVFTVKFYHTGKKVPAIDSAPCR